MTLALRHLVPMTTRTEHGEYGYMNVGLIIASLVVLILVAIFLYLIVAGADESRRKARGEDKS